MLLGAVLTATVTFLVKQQEIRRTRVAQWDRLILESVLEFLVTFDAVDNENHFASEDPEERSRQERNGRVVVMLQILHKPLGDLADYLVQHSVRCNQLPAGKQRDEISAELEERFHELFRMTRQHLGVVTVR